jgi:hypothetical protein
MCTRAAWVAPGPAERRTELDAAAVVAVLAAVAAAVAPASAGAVETALPLAGAGEVEGVLVVLSSTRFEPELPHPATARTTPTRRSAAARLALLIHTAPARSITSVDTPHRRPCA